jgi:hypothetical protein
VRFYVCNPLSSDKQNLLAMTLKRILLQSSVALVISALIVGCGPSSEKGKWTDGDKEKARTEIEKTLLNSATEGSEFFASKEVRDQFLDCSIGKLEQSYASYSDANKDLKGCEKIGEECALALLAPAGEAEADRTDAATQEETPNEQ